MGCLSEILMLFVEHHCRGAGEADAHPGGFVDLVLSKALFFGFFQVHFEAWLAARRDR